jgi:AGCS family alanine or glycine:cation symporter
MRFFGTIRTATLAWGLGDIGVGLMAWLNIIAILLLSRVGLATLKDYEAQRKSGEPLYFDPEKLGIRNAGLWKQIAKQGAKK